MSKIIAISEGTRRRISYALRNWHNPNSLARKRYEVAIKRHSKDLEAHHEAIVRSEQPDRSVIVY